MSDLNAVHIVQEIKKIQSFSFLFVNVSVYPEFIINAMNTAKILWDNTSSVFVKTVVGEKFRKYVNVYDFMPNGGFSGQ